MIEMIKDESVSKFFLEAELFHMRDTNWRLKFGAIAMALLMAVLIGAGILNIYVHGTLFLILPLACVLILIMPFREIWKTYNGYGFPKFNFRRKGWVFKNPTIVMFKYELEDDTNSITGWLNENMNPDRYHYIVSMPRMLGYSASTRFTLYAAVLFLDPKDAMLFKLSV